MRIAIMFVVLPLSFCCFAHAQRDPTRALTPSSQDGVATSAPSDPPTSYSILKKKVDERQQKIRAKLDEETVFEFIDEPLTEVVEYLRELHQIPIVIDTRALEDFGIGLDTPISRNLRGVSLRSALTMTLKEVDLTYLIHNEVLQITTPEAAESQLIIRIYPAGDLVAKSSGAVVYRESGRGESIRELVQTTIEPDAWDDVGGPGSITWVDHLNVFVISHTETVHDQVEALFESIRAVKKGQGKPVQGANRNAPDPLRMVVKIYKLNQPKAAQLSGGGMGGGGFGGGFGGVASEGDATDEGNGQGSKVGKKPNNGAADPFGEKDGQDPSVGDADPFADKQDAGKNASPSGSSSDDLFADKQQGGADKKRPVAVDPFGGGGDPFAKKQDAGKNARPSGGTSDDPFADKQQGGADKKRPVAVDPFGGGGDPFAEKQDAGKNAGPSGGTSDDPFADKQQGGADKKRPVAVDPFGDTRPGPAAPSVQPQSPPAAPPKTPAPATPGAAPQPARIVVQPLDTEALATLIKTTIQPDRWFVGGAATSYDNQLIVRQTEEVHEQIRQLLMQLGLLQSKYYRVPTLPPVVGGTGAF